MAYSFTVTDDFKVIVKKGTKKIDEVGAFDSLESAQYWATEVDKKYSENPTFVYPGEEPQADA